jgi:threonine synthase
MGSIKSLKCRECLKEYEPQFRYVCEECFGPLDVTYKELSISRHTFELREKTYWRYFELLPIANKSNIVSLNAGLTPLQNADRLGNRLGLKSLYIKNDSVNPTFSFKDRPAGVAVSRAKETRLKAVGCASTGNLAAATAAHAAKACHAISLRRLTLSMSRSLKRFHTAPNLLQLKAPMMMPTGLLL